MSLAVDRYLLEEMEYYEDLELLLDGDVSGMTLDHIFGWNEDEQVYEMESDELFPQPIRTIH